MKKFVLMMMVAASLVFAENEANASTDKALLPNAADLTQNQQNSNPPLNLTTNSATNSTPNLAKNSKQAENQATNDKANSAHKDEFKSEIQALVQEISDLSVQIDELNQKSDNNASVFSKEKATLKNQKQVLLERLPSVISKNLNEKFLKELAKQKPKNASEARLMDFEWLFYSSLLKVSELFKASADSSTMKESINAEFAGLEAKFDELKAKYPRQESDLSLKFATYSEILSYLSDNASLFESNYIFAEFRLQSLIYFINSYAKNDFIDTGKLVISALVLLLFWVLRVFLPPLILFCLMKLFFKNSKGAMDKAEVREIFIDKNTRPVSLLLFFYAFSVCFAIFYYPSPVNVKITNTFYIIYVVLFAWLIVGILNSYGIMFLAKLAQKSGKKEVANLIIKMLYFIIVIIALLLILAHLGFNVSAIIASLGIGGLAVALAAKDIIANFFASLIISFDDSFNQGDWIEVAGIEGNVVETGLRKTTLRTFDNSLVFLPNSTVMGANIKNWSKRKVGRHIKMILGVAYNAKPEQLESCVNDLRAYLAQSPLVAHADDNALNKNYSAKYRQNLVSVNDLEGYKNACYVSLCEFADSSINIELYFYTKVISAGEFREARQKLMLDFMRILEKNGLGFAFPSLSVYVENLKDLNEIKQ